PGPALAAHLGIRPLLGRRARRALPGGADRRPAGGCRPGHRSVHGRQSGSDHDLTHAMSEWMMSQGLLPWLGAYAASGAVVGFLAGLLGIGGGMTLVPVLAALFAAQQFAPDHTVHLALATAMASIVFTSSASVR